MIGSLRGKILEKKPPSLLIEVHGLGYEVNASMTTFYLLPDVGAETLLYTHLAIREDAHVLYGFHDQRERTLFRTLLKVNGVGPKLALTILSSVDPDNFVTCVVNDDIASLTKLPGVGKKTAERLIIDMRDRLDDWHVTRDVIVRNKSTQDAVSALIALGYKPQEASKAVSAVEADSLTSEQMIRLALQRIAS